MGKNGSLTVHCNCFGLFISFVGLHTTNPNKRYWQEWDNIKTYIICMYQCTLVVNMLFSNISWHNTINDANEELLEHSEIMIWVKFPWSEKRVICGSGIGTAWDASGSSFSRTFHELSAQKRLTKTTTRTVLGCLGKPLQSANGFGWKTGKLMGAVLFSICILKSSRMVKFYQTTDHQTR